jgi:transcription elongation GreA/GreB family factor
MGGIPKIDKRRLLEALLERLQTDLATIEASQSAAQAGATHEETRAEHAKDTRAIEAQYVARGLAERGEVLREAIQALSNLVLDPLPAGDGVAITALVTLEDDETGIATHYFLVPKGGGERLEQGGAVVQSLTPASPLGRMLMGRDIGDEIVLERTRGVLHATLVALR